MHDMSLNNNKMIERQYYTQMQACEYIGICRTTLQNLIKKHKKGKRLLSSKLTKKRC